MHNLKAKPNQHYALILLLISDWCDFEDKSERSTWDVLYDVGHECTEVTANVPQCVRVLVIFSLQQLPGQINILKQCAVQRVALSIQPSTGSARQTAIHDRYGKRTDIWRNSFSFSYVAKVCSGPLTSDWWHQRQPATQKSGPAGPWGCHDACAASCSADETEQHCNSFLLNLELCHSVFQSYDLILLTSGLLSRASFMMGFSSSINSLKKHSVKIQQRLRQKKKQQDGFICSVLSYFYLKATGLVLPSPNTRDSVMSMLSERIMGTMCLNREEGDGVPTIC